MAQILGKQGSTFISEYGHIDCNLHFIAQASKRELRRSRTTVCRSLASDVRYASPLRLPMQKR